jgi:DNA-directed RNA polymerase specialized sigma24 family protein
MVGHPAAEPTDADLVRRALDGGCDAFEAIYLRYHALVYRFARSMTGSRTMADDVTQEVFLVLMRDLARYDPQRAGLSTYLYGVARTFQSSIVENRRLRGHTRADGASVCFKRLYANHPFAWPRQRGS